MKVIIAGGGIGGLTTALMLHVRGIQCEVFEQSDQIRELGVGINTLPHAIKELAALGLLQRLDAVAIRTYELFYTNRFGQEIWREPRGLDAGYDVPQFSIHRGRLQGVIHDAVRDRKSTRLTSTRFPYTTLFRSNTLPHAIKELAALGLLQRLDAVAIRTYELFYTNRFGQEIWREPRGLDAGYDVPQFSIHRGRLQGVIHDAV